jgi:hypothetical protein
MEITGTISASASGGKPPYSCSWSAGASISVAPTGCSATVTRNANWNDHGQEGIGVTVCDANGRCDGSHSAIVQWNTPVPSLSISPTTVAFGSTKFTETESATLTVTNSGAVPIDFTIGMTQQTSEGAFSRTGTCPTAGQLAAGASCTIIASYRGADQCGGQVRTETATYSVSVSGWATSVTASGSPWVYSSTHSICQ